MGDDGTEKQEASAALFYELSLKNHALQDHLLRSIDRFVELDGSRQDMAEFYSHTRRPSTARQCIGNAQEGIDPARQ